MKKGIQIITVTILLIIGSFAKDQLSAQCTPPMSTTCNGVKILCSLDELDGYACTNSSTVPSPCSPVCSQGGVANNTSWWGFFADGGNVSITLTIGSCTNSQGLEFGIWADCTCSQEVACRSVPCVSPGSIETITADLVICKSYFLWVDGCNGDICDFTINTSGGGPPQLYPMGFINNEPSGIIDSVCRGSCNYHFFIYDQGDVCDPAYEWKLDGVLVGIGSETWLDFPNEGDFQLCVSGFIGNPQNQHIICSEQTVCATIKVGKSPDKFGLPRTLCWEAVHPGGYHWHSQKIYTSGIYNERFTDANCCKYDSVVGFTVLEEPIPESVYFITCDNKPYTDVLGKKHQPCLTKSTIILQNFAKTKCDSSIILTAVNVDFAPTWGMECINGMVELVPNVKIITPCNAGETYEFEYKWFKKSDPNHSIGKDERLLVNSVSEDYCIEVTVRTSLESEVATCTKTFCETFDEGNSAPVCSFKLNGNKVFCFDPIADYGLDSIGSPKVNSYTWTVNGGALISNPDSSSVKIKWAFNPKDSGKVCASYNTDCGTSCQKCVTVLFQTKIAGEDFDKRGLDAYLDAKPNPNGTWRLISGPYNVHIEDSSNPRTRISAYNYGVYCFEWTINDSNCVMKDTMCVDLHSFPKANPTYPKLLFFERAGLISDQEHSSQIIFTPNLINNNGESYVNIDDDITCKLNYRWFDIYGRAILQNNILIETGIQRLKFNSPIHEGMYYLVFEINGVSSIRKVCVIE